MPVGPYRDWKECIEDQLAKGKSEESAQKICGFLEQQSNQTNLSFNYDASVRPLIRDGKRLAKIYVIDQSMSGNDWGITPQAKNRGAHSLIGRPLLGPPELGHDALWKVGKFVDYETDESGTIYGYAEITDDEAWPLIQSGTWSKTSPRVLAKIIKETPEGKERVEDFIFEHVAFCTNPAFPHSGVESTFEAEQAFCGFTKALEASLNHSHSIVTELPGDYRAKQIYLATFSATSHSDSLKPQGPRRKIRK